QSDGLILVLALRGLGQQRVSRFRGSSGKDASSLLRLYDIGERENKIDCRPLSFGSPLHGLSKSLLLHSFPQSGSGWILGARQYADGKTIRKFIFFASPPTALINDRLLAR